MAQLSAATSRDYEVPGHTNDAPVAASVAIYKGSAVGYLAGYARQLVAGDRFAGFAEGTADNSAVATDGAINVRLRASGTITLAVGSVAVTDIGAPVYASDGNTFTLTAGSNTRIGTVKRFVSTGYAQVEFNATDANSLGGVTALTDSSTGTAADTLAAGVGIETITVPLTSLATGLSTSAIDLLTNLTIGYKFKVLGFDFVTTVAGTGTSASQVFNLEIGTTNVTGGVLTLLLADTDTIGKITSATAITAANTGAANATLSIEMAASGTVFTAGAGYFRIKIQNMDTADAVASLAAKLNQIA